MEELERLREQKDHIINELQNKQERMTTATLMLIKIFIFMTAVLTFTVVLVFISHILNYYKIIESDLDVASLWCIIALLFVNILLFVTYKILKIKITKATELINSYNTNFDIHMMNLYNYNRNELMRPT